MKLPTIQQYLKCQADWSDATFGYGPRTAGILDHISKELKEIEADPYDLEEWIDVIILAFDGYMRHGGTPARLIWDLKFKQDKNFSRKWPTPKPRDLAIEHIKEP